MRLSSLILATKNIGKLKEAKRILEPYGIVVKLPEKDIHIEEEGCSFLENAYLKADAYYNVYSVPILAEDAGLEVDCLGGYPGIYSSRFYSIDYGGTEEIKDSVDETNIRKVLRLTANAKDRSARFVSFFVLHMGDGGYWSRGECKGKILKEPAGEGGFGYDPIFSPEGFNVSLAQLKPEDKDKVSHRGKALRSLMNIIKNGGLL
ncbi:MAG: RdgB/HAM1 family non-canonical purine NTP pyrophosphatase [Aquificaceae bacterium]